MCERETKCVRGRGGGGEGERVEGERIVDKGNQDVHVRMRG